MKIPNIKTSLWFANGMPDNTLITFCRNIYTLLYALPEFTNIPVPAAVLLEGIETFAAAKSAQPNGGQAGTAFKNNKRRELLISMRKLAIYVQEACGNDLALLLATGFSAASTNRTRYALSKPSILKITQGMSGEALVTMTTEGIARGCEVRFAEIFEDGRIGEFQPAVFSSSSRNISVPNLIPGKLYVFQGRTMGGTTTYSDWSDQQVQRVA